jgi:thioredoxin reductase
MEHFVDNIIIGAGPAGLQLAYFLKKNNINYIHFEKNDYCAGFFDKFPHSSQLISINKRFTGKTDPEFNYRHDWNSLLNDEGLLFKDFSKEFYPGSQDLFKYLNHFAKSNELDIKYNTEVKTISKSSINGYNYNIKLTNTNEEYYCKKLIIGTGLSLPNIPEFNYNVVNKVRHYYDFPKNFFKQEENLKNYENKKVLIIGSGNSSYELANILNNYCSSIIILGSSNNMSIVSHYAGDLRSINLPFLDTFYLKTLNGIDILSKVNRNNLSIIQNNSPNDPNYLKYQLMSDEQLYYSSSDLEYFDDIILCTGWKFNSKIFNFDLDLTNNNKYPKINYKYESTNNTNLFFIGSLMHSLDFKKSSGGFIHGFRYLIRFFTQMNFGVEIKKKVFKFDGTLNCYNELSEYIYNRINSVSSMYQMFGVLADYFYWDKGQKEIVYIHDVTYDYILDNIPNFITSFSTLKLLYNEEYVYDIRKLGGFDKYNPKFLHPEISIINKINNKWNLVDKIIFEEDLVADFKGKKYQDKIKRALKSCPLII